MGVSSRDITYSDIMLSAGRHVKSREKKNGVVGYQGVRPLVPWVAGTRGLTPCVPTTPFFLCFRKNFLQKNPVNHTHLSGAAIGIHVLTDVFLRKFIDVGVCAVFGDLDDLSLHRQMPIRVFRVLNAER